MKFIPFIVLALIMSFNAKAQKISGDIYKLDTNKIKNFAKEALDQYRTDNMTDYNVKFYKTLFTERLLIAKLDKTPEDYYFLDKVPAYNKSLKQED